MAHLGRQLADCRLRRAGAQAGHPASPTPDAAARGRLVHAVGRRAPTSSPTSAGRCCSTTSSSTPPRSAGLAAQARPLVQSRGPVDRHRPRRPGRRGRGAGRAGQQDPAHRRRHAAPRPRPRGHAARRRRSRSPARAGPPTCCARPSGVKAEPIEPPKGFVGELRSYQAEALAWLGFLDCGRARRLPRPRHGPGQDARRCWPTCWPTAVAARRW